MVRKVNYLKLGPSLQAWSMLSLEDGKQWRNEDTHGRAAFLPAEPREQTTLATIIRYTESRIKVRVI